MSQNNCHNFKISGALSPAGEELIAVEQRGRVFYASRQALLSNSATNLRDLSEQGCWVGGQAQGARLLEAAVAIGQFKSVDIVATPGWNGAVFARPDGQVLVPSKARKLGKPPGIGFFRHPGRHRLAGSLGIWKQDVASGLLSDDLAVFIISVALAPTVRNLMPRPVPPFGVQIVIDQELSTYRSVAESVVGSMDPDFLTGDPFQNFITKPERYVAASRDQLLLLDDIDGYLCGSADKKRTAAVRSVLFDQLLPSGRGENSLAGHAAPVFMLVERTPLATRLDLDSAAAARLDRTLLTIDLTANTETRWSRNAAWIEATSKMTRNYGVVLKCFQRKLVEERAKVGFEALQAELERRYQHFRRKAQGEYRPERLGTHILDAFSLLYTTFRMAEHLDVLPTLVRKPPALWTFFQRFMAAQPQPVTTATLLKELAARPGVLNVDNVEKGTPREQIERAPAFLKTTALGMTELWVWTERKKEVFDWPALHKLPDFTDWYLGDGEKGRNGGKKTIGGHSLRVVRFKLPG